MSTVPPLSRAVLLRVFLRSLALQASWNPKGMQNLGLVYALATAGCAVLGFFLGPCVERLPLDLLRGLAWAFPAMASVAAALAAQGSHAKRAPLYASLGAAVVILVVILRTYQERR